MKIKTAELIGAALDWAVAESKGYEIMSMNPLETIFTESGWKPSTSWAQGGPIIERERLSVISDYHEIKEGWLSETYDGQTQEFGPTPLIAAMRCYVASVLGKEIDIPEELI